MKIRNVSMLAAAVAAVGLTSSASAITISDLIGNYVGALDFKIRNYDEGTTYPLSVGTTSGAGNVDLIGGQVGDKASYHSEDGWGIFKVTGIYGTSSPNPLWTPSAGMELTGIYFGLTDVYVDNAVISGTGTQTIRSTGVKFLLFADNTPDFNETPGPAYSVRTANDRYTTATDGTLILSGNSTAGFGFEFQSSLNFVGGVLVSSTGVAYGKWGAVVGDSGVQVGNSNAAMGSILPPLYDFSINFSGKAPGLVFTPPTPIPANPWLLYTDDPMSASVARAIPTPAAVWGGVILAGMVGVHVYRRRRTAE